MSTEFSTIKYGSHDSQYVEQWQATSHAARRTAILIHGGYWRDAYSCDLMHPMARHLAGNGWTVLNIEYRRVTQPEADQPTEAEQASTWSKMAPDVLAGCELAQGPSVLIGHSAGGQLALWAAPQLSRRPVGIVALAPLADLATADRLALSNHATKELFGDAEPQRGTTMALASPLNALPLGLPQLVVHGAADENVPPAMSDAYVEQARRLGDTVDHLAPSEVDHFHIIDPSTQVWRDTEALFTRW